MNEEITEFSPDGTVKIFHFYDNGQDFIKWFVDKEAKVLGASPSQSDIWRGCIVAHHVMELAEPGDEMQFIAIDGSLKTLNHKIKRIEKV